MKKQNIRILFIIPSPFAFKQFLGELAVFLMGQGMEVHVVTNKYEDQDLYIELVHYHFLNIPRNITPISAMKLIIPLRKIIKSINPGLIHSHFTSAVFLTSISLAFSKIPKIATIQGVIYTATKNPVKKFILFLGEHFTYLFQDKVIVLTEDDFIKTRRFASNINIQKSYGFGVNLIDYQPCTDKYELRKKMGFSDHDFIILFVGRLTRFKGFPIVIKTIRELVKKHKNAKIIVCGKKDNIHDVGISEQEFSQLENSDYVKFTGFIDNVKDYYCISDINIFPSFREGMPVNLMESIAMGLPVVTSNSRGCRHVVIHEVNGIVSDSSNYESYVKILDDLIVNKAKINRLKDGCYSTRIIYDRQLFVKETYEEYVKIFLDTKS